MARITEQIAQEISARPGQVAAAMDLLDEGATVPFIARYRKERTGGLDDGQLRLLETRLTYLRELEARRDKIIAAIEAQGKLDAGLRAKINAADNRTVLEDLYLPFREKRRTKAQIAREAGLQPLAETLLKNPAQAPEQIAASFVNPEKGVADGQAALDGAREILVEKMGEDAALLGQLRKMLKERGRLSSKVKKGKKEDGEKFADYFDFSQNFQDLPSHRVLAILRGLGEKVLSVGLDLEVEDGRAHPCETQIATRFNIRNQGRAADAFLTDTVHSAWISKLKRKLVTELIQDLREKAEADAISVFATNLKDLLLAAPAGARATMGLDPGYRTGVKVAVVDATGKLLATDTIYPHQPQNQWRQALDSLARLIKAHKVEIISIGNGTASRETDKLASELIKALPDRKITKVMVSEAGASVYSASELAAQEFPDLDVSLRGAVSIARRLQDPLAELVKIEPKSIGVGQYQHDVDQGALARSLDATVEDCVNAVGVDVNMASAALLTHIAGLNQTLASNIVAFRDANGPYGSRAALKKVPRLGPKAFEQAAGFLRIRDAKNPLDGSAVHPEAYGVVQKIAKDKGRTIKSLIGDAAFLKTLNPAAYTDDTFGVPTITDILAELDKPGRDPRPSFKVATFAEGVETIKELKPGMRLEGVVTNVTNFGAFVDIGVHQDGLVHISQLADRFVKDPHEVVKAGDIVRARVLEVDTARKRISLSLKSAQKAKTDAAGPPVPQNQAGQRGRGKTSAAPKGGSDPESSNPFAEAFRKARR